MPARKIPLVWKGQKESDQTYFKYNPATQRVVQVGCVCPPCFPPDPVEEVILSDLTSSGGTVSWSYTGPETIFELKIYESPTLPVDINGAPIYLTTRTLVSGSVFTFPTSETYYYVASIRIVKTCLNGRILYSDRVYSEPEQYPCQPPDPIEEIVLSDLTTTGGTVSWVYSGPESIFELIIFESPTLPVDISGDSLYTTTGALVSGSTFSFPAIEGYYYLAVMSVVKTCSDESNAYSEYTYSEPVEGPCQVPDPVSTVTLSRLTPTGGTVSWTYGGPESIFELNIYESDTLPVDTSGSPLYTTTGTLVSGSVFSFTTTNDYYYVASIRVLNPCPDESTQYSEYTYSDPVQKVLAWIFTARESNRNWLDVTSSSDGTKLAATVLFGQIYTSTDSGVTWTSRDSNRAWDKITSSSDGTKLATVVFGGQIYTSTDSGATWTPQESNRNWFDITSSSDGTKLAAVENGGQIYTSTDSGVTWTPQETNRNWKAITSSSDGTKLVAVVNSGGQIYTSTDSGVTWTPRDSNRDWWDVASSSDGTKLAAVVAGGQIYTSVDSGVTWTPQETNRQWLAIASSSDGTKLVADLAVAGQLYTSDDSGITWIPQETNRNWRGVATSSDGTKIVATVFGGQIYTGVYA